MSRRFVQLRARQRQFSTFVLTRKVVLLLDYPMACEYRDVALRSNHVDKSDLSAKQIERLLDTLEGLAIPVDIYWQHRPLSIDPDDDLVLDLAINGRADVIVTNNLRHLHQPAQSFGIKVVDAKTFIIAIKEAAFNGNAR